MMKFSRKIVVFIALTGFLLSSANVFLYIHLVKYSHDRDGHNEDKCPVCQQAAINKTKAIILINATIFESQQISFKTGSKPEILIKTFDFLTPHLRAPPAIS